jgi:transcriptional regulator with XRE-family HTH domain
MDEVAAAIAKRGHEHVSANYIWMLRKGLRDNPTLRAVEALAHFFGVPPSYFFEDDDLVPRLGTQLDPLAKMRDSCIRDLKLRAVELPLRPGSLLPA